MKMMMMMMMITPVDMGVARSVEGPLTLGGQSCHRGPCQSVGSAAQVPAEHQNWNEVANMVMCCVLQGFTGWCSEQTSPTSISTPATVPMPASPACACNVQAWHEWTQAVAHGTLVVAWFG